MRSQQDLVTRHGLGLLRLLDQQGQPRPVRAPAARRLAAIAAVEAAASPDALAPLAAIAGQLALTALGVDGAPFAVRWKTRWRSSGASSSPAAGRRPSRR